jgi:glycosyltransferase involved in cell wall biosynthesis
MPYERMMAHTRHALVGLTLDKDSNLNYRFSLPNKLFDYLQAGVPVVATDLPEVAAIVREHGCGLVIPAPEPAIIAAAVQRLTADPHQHDAMRQRAIFAARSLDGEREKEVLKAFLARLG